MTRVPDVLVRRVFEPAWDLYERSVRLRTLRSLRQSQWFDRQRLEEMRRERLRALVVHAAETCSFYGERFRDAGLDPRDLKAVEELRALPLLTKSEVRNSRAELLSSRFQRGDLTVCKTGGSTGVALELFVDSRCAQMRNGAALRADEWSGWRLGEPIGAVWGNPPTATTWRNKLRSALKERIIYLDTMKIDDEAVDVFLDQWRQTRPGLLYGHAHSLYILAEKVLERGDVLRPRGIVATSMMLIDSERRVIEQAFGVPVTNRYGCEEVSLIACECEVHRGMHLTHELKIVEFLNDEGHPCASGEDGRIVVTDLTNFAMPFIRYETGDRGVPTDRLCECGRQLPLMESITGRTADFLLALDGYRVAGISLIENTLTKYPGIKQLQIVQEEPRALYVNLVRGAGYDDETQRALIATLREALGQEIQVEIRPVEAIPQERSGKYRFAICKI